jgi:2-methylcitrate dehydratase PrpD
MTQTSTNLDRGIDALLERVAGVGWHDLDDATRDATSRVVFDALGIAAGGAAAPGIAPSLRGLTAVAGHGDVPVPWSALRLPAADAAFALSLLIHAWDFDDTHDEAVVHAATVAVPAAYSVACATGATGQRFLEGVVAGVETILRLSLVLGAQTGMSRTAGLGPLGAAAAAARVLDLGPAGTAAALSLATPMSASPTTRQVIEDGAITKRHQPGFGVRHGVLAAALAQAGVEGAAGWFTGTYGLGALVSDPAATGPALDREGWEVTRLSLKPYPACRYVHAAVAGALELRARVDADDVRRVEVHVPVGMAHELVARKWARRGRPIVDAQFSIPWSVAAALVRGDLDLGALTDEALHDETTEDLATRIEVVQDLEANGGGMTPVWVELTLGDETTHRSDVTALPGSPDAPLGWEAITTKVRGCLAVAGLDPSSAEALAAEVAELPTLDRFAGLRTTTIDADPASAANDEEPSTWTSA